MLHTQNPALLIIDCQLAIDTLLPSERSNGDAEWHIKKLLHGWRHHKLPIIHVRHASHNPASPYHRSLPSFRFKEIVAPVDGEKVVTKSENCAFIHTDLDEYLKSRQITEIVVCGVLTHHSVDATVRHASSIGYRVVVPENCTASYGIELPNGQAIDAELVQAIYLANLNGEYCHVVAKILDGQIPS